MATKSKNNKPRTTSKSSKGSSGLKKNKFNIKFLALVILPVAIIGGFFVYRAKAAGKTFNQEAQLLSGGDGYVDKGGGSSYRIARFYKPAVTTNIANVPISSQICADFTIIGDGIANNIKKTTVRIEVSLLYSQNKIGHEARFTNGGSHYICLNTNSRADVKDIFVYPNGFPEDSGFGVHRIYGKP